MELVAVDMAEDLDSIPRFMVIDDGTAPYIQTDITIPVVGMVVLVSAVSGVVLYVGLREFSFYTGWSSRFNRYMERKTQVIPDRRRRIILAKKNGKTQNE